MNLTAIACMASNRIIGADGVTPWHHPADLRFFKGKTLGHTVVMGRKTWESLPDGPLPHRRNIVLSRYLLKASGAEVAMNVRSLSILLDERPAFVVGGAEVYRLLMPWTNEVLLTVLDAAYEGDTLMPEFEEEFGPPEILNRAPGIAEWRRYVRKQPSTNQTSTMADPVNSPTHYTSIPARCSCGRTLEPIDFTRHMSFNLGNAAKYVLRAPYKGNPVQDLKKALWYINDELTHLGATDTKGAANG